MVARVIVLLVVAFPTAVAAAQPPLCFGHPATIRGSGVIQGTPGEDVIVGSSRRITIDPGFSRVARVLWVDDGRGNDTIQGNLDSDAHLFGGMGMGTSVTQEFNGGPDRDRGAAGFGSSDTFIAYP